MNHKNETPRARTGAFFVPVSGILSMLLVCIIAMAALPSAAIARGGSYTRAVNCILKLRVTPEGNTTVSGGEINYTLVATNVGQGSCSTTELTDYYPDNEEYVSSSIEPDAPSFYWLIGRLPPGQSYSLSLTTKNVPDGTSQVLNTACVSADGVRDVCIDNTISIVSSAPAPTPAPTLAPIPAPTPAPTQIMGATTEAWIYPGNPACRAASEYSDGRVIDTLKPEYYQIQSNGTLRQMTVASDGCNGYSASNAADIKAHSTHQYATVSGDITNVHALLSSASLQSAAINTLTNFVVGTGFTGIELDWEQFDNWLPADYSNFKKFTTDLGNSLHSNRKKLMIDAPALTSAGLQFRYEDFANLDYVAIMVYDYQYDYGVGQPVAPESWITNVVKYAKSKLPADKIVIGIPSYGYHGTVGSYTLAIDTYAQSSAFPGFSTRKVNSEGEEAWVYGNTYYSAQPQSNLDRKKALLESLGIKNISVWHLGGNNWFSK